MDKYTVFHAHREVHGVVTVRDHLNRRYHLTKVLWVSSVSRIATY